MTVYIEKPAINFRAMLAKMAGVKPAPEHETFWFSGDGSTTRFTLQPGWAPVNVFVNGGLYRPGVAEDYTTSFDGFRHTIEMAVAPSAVDVAILAVRKTK